MCPEHNGWKPLYLPEPEKGTDKNNMFSHRLESENRNSQKKIRIDAKRNTEDFQYCEGKSDCHKCLANTNMEKNIIHCARGSPYHYKND